MGDKKWFTIILFDDADNDGQWDPWTPDSAGEASWWMNDKWFWFETWGDFRVNSDDANGNFVTQTVKDASGATLTDLNITIEQ